MNKLSINKVRFCRGGATGALILCAFALTFSAILAQSPTAPPQWPSLQKRPMVKKGFTRVLTLSATKKDLRDTLIEFTNQKKVRDAVQTEMRQVPGLEQEVIPNEIVMIFYEPQTVSGNKQMPKAVTAFLAENENRNYHVFSLPLYDPKDTAEHKYDNHIKCCYRPW